MRSATAYLATLIVFLLWTPLAVAQTCPATGTEWATANDGSWTVPSNWTNGVPDGTKEACILVAGTYELTLSSAATAKSLLLGRIDEDGTQTLVQSANLTLVEPGTVFAGGEYRWQSGTLAGSLTNQGLLRLATASIKRLAEDAQLINEGTIEHAAGNIWMLSNTFIDNKAGATFDSQGDVDITWSGGAAERVFMNNGTFLKSGGTGVSRISTTNTDFRNLGTVHAQVGEIRLQGDGVHTNGVFTAQSGGLVNFNSGTHTIVGGISGAPDGVVKVTGSTVQSDAVGATLAFGGTGLSWEGGFFAGQLTNTELLRLATASIKRLAADAQLINEGTIEHADGDIWMLSNTFIDNKAGATFDSQGDVDITWSGGAAERVFMNNGTFLKSGGTGVSLISTTNTDFRNLGTVHAQVGEIRLLGDGEHTNGVFNAEGAAQVNFAGGTHTITGGISGTPDGVVKVTGGGTTLEGDGSGATLGFGGTGLSWEGGFFAGQLTNTELLRLATASIKRLAADAQLINEGTIEHADGDIWMLPDTFIDNKAGATFDSQGDVEITWSGAAAERVFTNNGTFLKSGGTGVSLISTTNTDFRNLGTVNAQVGEIRLLGDGEHTNGVFNAEGAAQVNFAGGTHTITGGISGTPDGVVKVTGGTLEDDGSGATLAFGETGLSWESGNFAGTLTNTELLRLATTSSKTLTAGAELINEGTIEHAAGTLFFGGGARVNNIAEATFDSQGDVGFSSSNGGMFENNGAFIKSSGTGASTISTTTVAFDNLGMVDAQAGEIRLSGDGAHTDAEFTADTGALVNFQSGTHTFTGSITGAPDGIVRATLGTVTLVGTSGASFDFGGTGFEWLRGTLTGELANKGLLRLTSISPRVDGSSTVLTNEGDVRLEGSSGLSIRNGALVVNAVDGIFDLQGDGNLNQFGSNNRFENRGLFTKSDGTGNSIIAQSNLTFDNEAGGIVRVESGEIRLFGPFHHNEGALIEGVGSFNRASSTAAFTHAGNTGPGLSPGVLTWLGSPAYAPDPTANFIVDIAGSGGAGATDGHDVLNVSSSAALDGQIQVNLLDGFVPTQDEEFEVLFASGGVSGEFSNPNDNDQIYVGGGVAFTVIYEANRVLLKADLLEADIALDKTVNPAAVDVGQTATFTVTASKGSDADDLSAFGLEEDILISDILPSGLSLVNAIASAGSYDPDTGEWLLPELLAGENETLTLEVTVDEPGVFENTATLQAAELPDPNDDNDSASATVEGLAADLALEKTVSASSVLVDEAFSFTVTLTNNGPNDASDIEIADAIPDGLDCTVTQADGSYDDGVWTLATLDAEASSTLTFDCTAETPGTYTNVATRQASNPIDLDDSNDEADASIDVTAPATADLALEKTVSPSSVVVGESFAFLVTLTNNGPEDATDIVVLDEIPGGLECDVDAASGSYNETTGEWSVAELADDASTTLTFTCTSDAEGTFTNTASRQSSSPDDPNPANDEAQATVTVGTLPTADLALEKTVSPSTVVLGESFAFELLLTNLGPEDATDIVVVDEIPDGLDCTFDAASGTYDEGSGEWSVEALANGTSATLTFDCTTAAEGSFTNVASIQESTPLDPNPDNNEAEATVTVSAPECPVPEFTQDASTVPQGFVTLTFTSAEGLVEVNFTDSDDNDALVNFEASTEANFTSSDGIRWSFAGADDDAPTAVDFVLTAVPPPGLEPGDSFTASYFAQATNSCGITLDVDPVFTLSTQAPRTLAILGNYPNPFADATTIRFDLPEAGVVQVQIFDLMGREVATLVDAPLGAGTHEVTWNGALSNGQAIASGLYLVRLQAGGQSTTQRMTRVR